MATDDARAAGWTYEALDRLRAALKAEPEVKNQAGSNPTKTDGGDDQ